MRNALPLARRAAFTCERKWMLVASALMPHRSTRSLCAASSGSVPGVFPITWAQPSFWAGVQMVRSSSEAPSLWNSASCALRWMSPIVPA
jgi:hypothetical protein